jgi:hypothetical protein
MAARSLDQVLSLAWDCEDLQEILFWDRLSCLVVNRTEHPHDTVHITYKATVIGAVLLLFRT